jgi:dipeptidyl aminopeptidase/acylaminoacyl peptidase
VYLSAAEAFPGANIEVIDESWDAQKYLLLIRPPRRAGSYFLLDFEEGTLDPIGAMYDHLADIDLAETQSVEFLAADGGTISGHVTLPPGSAGTVPTVIIPRAQPSRLDISDPHYLVQYLVASGYAVLRLNHRGPEEYDSAWLPNRTAFAWERAAADIDSAMRYLVEQGVAEEDRICALGRDVGAYATFMNAIEYPGKLNCIIGIGATAQTGGGDWATVIAGDFAVLQKDSSPIRRSKDFDASVLLFHGQYDGIVQMLPNSADLSQSLDRKNFDITFIEYEYARHDIERAPYRVDMLTRIGQFLADNIGE